jgi:hypothetical protein
LLTQGYVPFLRNKLFWLNCLVCNEALLLFGFGKLMAHMGSLFSVNTFEKLKIVLFDLCCTFEGTDIISDMIWIQAIHQFERTKSQIRVWLHNYFLYKNKLYRKLKLKRNTF